MAHSAKEEAIFSDRGPSRYDKFASVLNFDFIVLYGIAECLVHNTKAQPFPARELA
jgi:hypothetical protein